MPVPQPSGPPIHEGYGATGKADRKDVSFSRFFTHPEITILAARPPLHCTEWILRAKKTKTFFFLQRVPPGERLQTPKEKGASHLFRPGPSPSAPKHELR